MRNFRFVTNDKKDSKNNMNIINKKYRLSILTFVFLSFASFNSIAQELNVAEADIIKGKELAFDRKKGNCLACHYIQGGTLMGNTGPALIAMKARFPDKQKLFNQVFDARTNNELTFMPPFGAHGALSNKEVQQIVDWLYTL